MTPDRAEQIVTKLCQYRDIGVAMEIPALYAEMVAEQGWRAIGYESWDALMDDRLGGWRLALPREERREAVAAMADKGMSTRAIGSALGVHHSTVADDLAVVGNPTTAALTTGLDGKTYPPKAKVTTTTRTSEATKVEQVVDTATGEIVEDAARRDPVPDEGTQRLRDYIANDPDIRAANLRKRLSSFIARIHEPLPDPVEMATIAPERAEDVAAAAQIVAEFAEKYRAALPKPTHLRAVRES